jgi:hypothetical protein
MESIPHLNLNLKIKKILDEKKIDSRESEIINTSPLNNEYIFTSEGE